MVSKSQSLRIRFKVDEKFTVGDLGKFLVFFEHVYTSAELYFAKYSDEDFFNENIQRNIKLFVESLSNTEPIHLHTESNKKLRFQMIAMNSPLEFIITASIVALVATVIVSGGKISILGNGIEIHQSIGKSLSEIKQPFSKAQKSNIPPVPIEDLKDLIWGEKEIKAVKNTLSTELPLKIAKLKTRVGQKELEKRLKD